MKLLGPDIGYAELLNHETAEAMEKESTEKRDFHPLRPSSAGHCTRELAYSLAEYIGISQYAKVPMTVESSRLLSLGHFIERHLIDQLYKYFKDTFQIRYKQQMVELFRLTSEKNPALNHIVEGSIDLCFWSPKYKGVVDVKSKKDKFNAAFKSDWEKTAEKLSTMASVHTLNEYTFWVEDLAPFLLELNDPFFASNFLQLNCYANTDFLVSRGVDHAAILQYNKNDSRIREIRFKPCKTVYELVRTKFENVIKAVEQGDPELARRDYALGSIKCAFCSYSKQCWGDTSNSLKEYFATWPKKEWPTETDKLSADLTALCQEYEAEIKHSEAAKVKEQEIIKRLVEYKVEKIKLPNGHIYDLKFYKTDKAFHLKRGKL